MTEKNFKMVLGTFCKRQPFRPFTMELVSGSRIEVHHPEAVRYQEGVLVYRSTAGIHSVFEHDDVVRFIEATGTV